ncbi:PKD domain-containing protein [Mumia qirimensis]|uniref:PKD domain-containing protein n=1 Tax=Mumia qirimensis TaxID=3234852 RepID=UPI00351D8322
MLATFRRTSVVVISAVLAAATVQLALGSATTAAPNHTRVVSEVPPSWTPAINNGSVRGIAQVGATTVAIGDFTSVTPSGGSSVARNGAVAFNATAGGLVGGFNPSFNGAVNDVIPGPTDTTVYVAGSFTQVNGTARSRIALLNLSNGSLVASFVPPNINGAVNSIAKNGNRIYVGGNFTAAANTTHGGLAMINATTGAIDQSFGNDVAERHNDTGSGAQGAIGVRDLEVTPDGSKLVAIGNFKKVDGLNRDQAVVINTTGAASQVAPDWRTRRYEPYCFNWAFDTYVRGVSISPDGSYFVVASTGGPSGGTLCDTAARFEFASTGDDIQPTWINYSGGDTLWGVEVTESAVYVGGHQRWMNNSLAGDSAGPGAVPRPGLAALDTETGAPLKWNAARNPRGAAVYALEATPAGLWMGSDTEYVGANYAYRRPRLAFFPHATGAVKASDSIAGLPGTAYVGGSTATSNGNILYRVNAGGSTVGTVDAGPDWEADDQGSSPYRNEGSNAAGWGSGSTTDNTVPTTTPNAVFDSERWSPSDDPAMNWAFAAPNGAPLQVRLFFSNRCSCTSGAGQRAFDVSIDGTKRLDNFDIVAAVGDQRGTMRAFNITSDGTVNIDFSHEVENPLINAIEIVRTDQAPPVPAGNSLRSIPLTTSGASPAVEVSTQGMDWSAVRGAFVAGGKLWYGRTNSLFYSRTISANGTLGPEVTIDPYNDPLWAGVSAGNNTGTYDGNRVGLYSQLPGVTSMAYSQGRLYYTRSGDANLYWRWFSTDSGIIGSDTFTANGGRSWNGTSGMFFANDALYFVSTNGNLNRIGVSAGTPSGAVTVVDGPGMSGNNWRGRAVYLTGATALPPNVNPTADFTSSCVDLTCTFTGAATDSDGTIAGYAWDFGDGDVATGEVANHTFDDPGTYSVKVVATDNRGGTGERTRQVQVTDTPNPSGPITFVNESTAAVNTASPSVAIPAGVQAGDTLLLTASVNNAPAISTPAGWTLVDSAATTGLTTSVWTREATASDAGNNVTVGLSAIAKTTLAITAYRGAGGVGATATSSDAATASHTTPSIAVPTGSWVVWFWADKSPNTADWTPGAGVTQRAEVVSSGSGRVSTFVGDTAGPRSGNVAGTTSVTDVASSRGVSWSIVLEPSS